MPSVMQLKPWFQSLLRPLCRRLAARGVTPNALTLLALLISVAVGALVCLLQRSPALLLVPLWMVLRLGLNTLDGMLAREHDLRTPLGALLNEVVDVLSDAALMLPFSLLPGVPAAAVVLTVVLGLCGEVAGLAALLIGAPRRYDGPLGKPDRAAAFALLALLLGAGVPAGRWTAALYLLPPLGVWTLANRIRAALVVAR